MRISLLLRREPFGELLERSLAGFLVEKYGKLFDVKWHMGSQSTQEKGRQLFYCNPWLNSIFVETAQPDVWGPVLKEYSVSTVWWKRPLQALYVRLATGRATRLLFAKPAMTVYPAIPGAKVMLIMGGNHHLRILDLVENCSHVIAKTGAAAELIRTELAVRDRFPFLPVPRVTRRSSSGRWYSETLIKATPINRIQNADVPAEVTSRLMQSLERLAAETAVETRLHEYCCRLLAEIEAAAAACKCIGATERSGLVQSARQIHARLLQRPDTTIRLCQAHGDFQPANMLFDGTAAHLIDWEYTGQRSVSYDFLTLHTGIRLLGPVVENAAAYINRAGTGPLSCCIQPDGTATANRVAALALFVLEDISLKLMENSGTHLYAAAGRLSTYVDIAEALARLV